MTTHPARSTLRSEIVAEASAWFIEFRTGHPAANVRNAFDEWLRQSPEHIEAYLEVAAAWADLPMSDLNGRIDMQALVDRARAARDEDVIVLPARNERMHAASSVAQVTPGRRRRNVRGLAAAFAVLSILVGAIAWLVLDGAQTYVTAVGEQRTIRLPDDSTVELNARSSIRVRFSKSVRAIELREGQAQFHVAKDQQRPFFVRTDGLAVRAVGTRFDVYRKRSGTVVTVIEGRVAVIPEGLGRRSHAVYAKSPTSVSSELLSTGEQLTATALHISSPHRADLNAATAWVQRRLFFDETPLAEVAEEFNRYSTRRLIVADSKLAGLRISGVYSSADPAALIGFLRIQPNLQVIETEQEFRVIRGEPR